MKRMLLLISLALPGMTLAADNMSFHGTLVAPPCKISNGQTIEVVFGDDLGVTKIDGNNYKKPVDYSITCDTGYSANNLAIVVDTTNPAPFDTAAVDTNLEGLGIRILVDGMAVEFAKRVAVDDPARPPQIEAVPVQDPAVTLTAGAFEATMTLRVDYL
ncbi:fimbrial protein [Atlantibacter sp.]|uniref:fimbrial protein n=1 Tax=Atlantibacter sp. TaxID=1903473 RepID=UPI0028B13D12|nr:fimbrial protein [Atlantibacter sp.]